ncbi:MAG: M48 family metalloprotease [Halieaceae bacterium]|nr:M48 family metalloprotease [Halieaceae bacterium]
MIKFAGQCLLAAVLFTAGAAGGDQFKLPDLGQGGSSLFSPEQEHRLGRAWLRKFRSQVPTLDDPLLHDYLENLIYRLVSHSELQDRRLQLVVVDNPVLNAFAVPGGVIGVHSGLLLYAHSEAELATVLAHEIAHLSQRHFSRGVERQQQQQPWTMAGMLAGLVLIATTGSSAGMAALSAAQAATLESQLRFSRSNEQEADRIGMQILAAAGLDPHAAPAMFERMLAASRRASQVPEFLRTHPLTENRISDTRSRARKYPRQVRPETLSFHLMRARVQVHHADTPVQAVSEFRGELEGQSLSREAALYGLVLALQDSGQSAEARREIQRLLDFHPNQLEYLITSAAIEVDAGDAQAAVQNLANVLKLHPGNHALTMAYAHALQQNGQAHIAEQVLLGQSRLRPEDSGLWYLLAEVSGLSGNIAGLHRARAEYFMLNGVLDEAGRQLEYALRLSRDHRSSALISQRMKDLEELRSQMEL